MAENMDVVTQLQGQITRLTQLFYETVGELQQKANPVPIVDEELQQTITEQYNAEERSKGFSTEILQVFKNIDSLVAKLPDQQGSEQEQIDRIVELQRLNDDLRLELQKEKEIAEVKLRQAQDMYAVLAQNELKQRMEEHE